MDWDVRRMRENRNEYRFSVGNTGGKRPLERRSRRAENNAQLDRTKTRNKPSIATSTMTKKRVGRREIGLRFSVEKIDSVFSRYFRPLRVPPCNLANSLSRGQKAREQC